MICPRCFKEIMFAQCCPFCGFSFEKENARREKVHALPMLFMLADRYELGEILGSGGFGITYLARDVGKNEILAVKEFFPSSICTRDKSSNRVVPYKSANNFETSVKHFYEEAKTLFVLKNCPSVVCVKAFFRSNNTAYIVMEYIKGKNLNSFADEMTKKVPYRLAKNFVVQIALALSEVHTHGMIHSDISPVNVLVNEYGDVKLIDFGASRRFLEKDSENITVQLKPGFAPPELYLGSKLPLGPWTDVYELAATFYRLITGEVPPTAEERNTGKKPKNLIDCVPDIEEKVAQCIDKALSMDYKNRYSDINEFLSDFSDYALIENRTDETSVVQGELTDQKKADPKKNVFSTIFRKLKKEEPETYIATAEIFVGLSPGKQFRLFAGKQYFVGRQADICNIVISDQGTVSRVHCVLICSEDGRSITIADKSSNGLSINNGPKLMGQSATISDSCNLVFSNGTAVLSIIWNQR